MSPGSIGTAEDIASKTETAQEVLARLEESEIKIFLQCIRGTHARDLIALGVPGDQTGFRAGY